MVPQQVSFIEVPLSEVPLYTDTVLVLGPNFPYDDELSSLSTCIDIMHKMEAMMKERQG